MVCNTAEMITLPPSAPTMITGSPSFNSMVGTIPVVRALPGIIELAMPGIGSASFIELL